MRKTIAFAVAFALAICGTTFAAQCGDNCGSSSDCADAGTCRLCIDGTCQHRCAFHNSQDVPFLGAVCGDACSSSSDCATAGDCRLCIDGICQHRCMNDEPVKTEEPVTIACGDKCSSSSDCANAGDCRLCIDGIC